MTKSYLDDLAPLKVDALFQRFTTACDDPEKTQAMVLNDILRRNADCLLGRRWDFSTLDGPDAFRRRVPLTDWQDYEALSAATGQGNFDQMFVGKPVHFLATSGTTAALKLYPESREGELAKRLTSTLRRYLSRDLEKLLTHGKLLVLFNPVALGNTPCGLKIGAASGLAMEDSLYATMLPFPKKLLECRDPDFQIDAIMRFSAAANVVAFGANNIDRFTMLFERARARAATIIREVEAGTLELAIPDEPGLREAVAAALKPDPARAAELRDVFERTGDFLPAGYWPNLKAVSCWLGGSVGRGVGRIRPYLPDGVVFKDAGYGASEGKFNVPVAFDTAAGALALWGAFYEFLPDDGGEPVPAQAVRDGEVYELIVTTHSGLYRYRMHDRVRVVGFTGRTPNIVFESKSSDYANVAGEKSHAGLLVAVVEELLRKASTMPTHWAVYPDGERKEYVLCLESADPPSGLDKQFDEALRARSVVYAAFRDQGLIAPPVIAQMKPGWKESLLRGKDVERSKLPVVLRQPPEDYLMENFRP